MLQGPPRQERSSEKLKGPGSAALVLCSLPSVNKQQHWKTLVALDLLRMYLLF